ncbi:MAG: DNA translocase FtsK 4TM domain-containing protein [Proteobacteria bacterium]|nr:DNA translocase FtsK 4TM domain-containing protein [Pseudomonadota bacterium]
MAQEKKNKETPAFGQEIVAVFGIFIALFLLLSLLSLSTGKFTLTPDANSGNWCGIVGEFTASLLISFLGLSSFWFPFLLFIYAIQLFSPHSSLKRLPYIIAGCSGIVITSAGLWASIENDSISLFGRQYQVGGNLGDLLAVYSGKALGGPGSLLFFIAVFLISMMVAIRFSPYLCSLKISQIAERLRDRIRQRINQREALNASQPVSAVSPVDGRPVAEGKRQLVPRVHEPVKLLTDDEDDDFHPLPVTSGEYRLPGIGLLDKIEEQDFQLDKEYYYAVSKKLEEKLKDFGVEGSVSGISPGPVITTYEYSPAPGVKINRVVALADDLALGLKAESVRIVGSIPGKAALGIEIPNPVRRVVQIRDILGSENFQKATSKLTIGLGMDVVGNPVMANLAKMPHLLIAGATGAGKSVGINSIICSILFKASPEEVRLLMVDPKRIELSSYEDIPHLLHPVVVDPKLASRALQWAVREMERRYKLMEEKRVKSLAAYNEVSEEKLPLIVIIIDELADLMMVSSREVEDAVARLAQMARAAGMHLILATQRPSVDVLTGLIKANFPTRISYKVSSKIDSRTILDSSGAEHLLGAGDMLLLPPGSAKLQRIHGAYITEKEIERIVTFLKEQGVAQYDDSVLAISEEIDSADFSEDDYDEKYDEAVALVCETGQASISMLQRRMRVGYNRAARMVETMEKEGIVGPPDGSKPREVLARKSY